MKKTLLVSTLALGVAAMGAVSNAEAKAGVKVGVLTCDIEGGVGYVLGSSKKIDCTFKPGHGHRAEHYHGSIGKLGVDLGITGRGKLAWVVFAPGNVNRGGLAGNYIGASAQATVIGGLGANVLVGGFRKTINLQPISIQGQTGLNVAAGIASLTLHQND